MSTTLTRAISGAIYVVVLVTCIFHSHFSLVLLFGLLLLICSYEYARLIQLNKLLATSIALFFYLGFYFISTTQSLIFLTFIAIFTQIKALFFLFNERKKTLDYLSKILYLIGYLTTSIIIVTKLPLINTDYNPKLVLGIFILIWVNDTFAYLVGRSLGKRKLYEKVSPKKTVEGCIGGMIFCGIAGSIIAHYMVSENILFWIIIAILVSIFSTVGDLFESKLKRIAQVKDSGTIMPGHGGMLDRLDSIIFVAPVVYLLYQILHHVS